MVGKGTETAAHACQRATRAIQLSLVTFFALAAVSLLAIYIVAPAVYTETLGGRTSRSDPHPLAATALLAGVVLFVALLSVGVLRRWRWLFWLVLVAFTLSVLQIPGGILELTGIVPASFPAWYIVFRMLVGAVQFAIGLAMIRLYRRCGVWARSHPPVAAPYYPPY